MFHKLSFNSSYSLTALLFTLLYTYHQGGLTLPTPLGWCQVPLQATHRGILQQPPRNCILHWLMRISAQTCIRVSRDIPQLLDFTKFRWQTLPTHLPYLCETKAGKTGWLVRPHWQDKRTPLKDPQSYWRQKAMDWVPCQTQKADICFAVNAKRNSLSQA